MWGTPEDEAPSPEQAARTVLFADVVDSTKLYVEDGDQSAKQQLLGCISLMAAAVDRGGGTVLERIGDEILCVFETPDSAARAAASLQQQVDSGFRDGSLPRPMSVRVCFEHGSTILDGERIFGATVHTAARLTALAKAGQTLTTRETLDHLHPVLRRLSRPFDRRVLKGQPGEREVYELLWDSGATIVGTAPAPQPAVKEATTLELSHGGRLYRIDTTTPRLDLGRHSTCSLRVDSPAVSKLHARVVWDRGKVRLEDLSTNGTYVTRDGGPPVFLHHEAMDLLGSGRLTLGGQGPGDPASEIAYRCLRTGP